MKTKDQQALEDLKTRYKTQKPHRYEETNPYRGCAYCGFGPGASFHNIFEVERYLESQKSMAAPQ